MFAPKLVTCLRRGMKLHDLMHDCMAGIVVGIISIPLGMAFAIASGLPPERGLFTSVVAGLIVALLGGSRFQIAGPTGAFVVVVFDIVARQGYDGLVIATLIASVFLVLMGLFRFGGFLKYIPYPVITGLTSGLAVILFTTQIKDFLGLRGVSASADFFTRWGSYFQHFGTLNVQALILGVAVILVVIVLRRVNEKLPGPVIAMVVGILAVIVLGMNVETIRTKFGAIPNFLPDPHWPRLTLERVKDLMPDAITIAVLAGMESLLSAVVADSMSGDRHRPDTELIAQGVGNFGSVLFGGMPATGAIARTATNVRCGAKSPMAGVVAAAVVFAILYCFAKQAELIPLCALAALVIYIAVKMFDGKNFLSQLRGTKGDAVLLLTSFALTVLIDITVAVEIGVLLAALIFTKKMGDTTTVESTLVGEEIQIVEVKGPLFFAVSHLLEERVLDCKSPFVILRLHDVGIVDMTGIEALRQLHEKLKKKHRKLLLSEANPRIIKLLENARLLERLGPENLLSTKEEAIHLARSHGKHYNYPVHA